MTSHHMLCCAMRQALGAVCSAAHAARTPLQAAIALHVGLNGAWVTGHCVIACVTGPQLYQLAALSSCLTHVLICSGGFQALFNPDS